MRELVDVAQDFAGGVMCFLEPGSYDNMACNAGLAGPVPEADIERFIRFYESRGVEPRIELTFYADESFLLALGARGFTVREMVHVLARPIDETIAALAPERGWPAGPGGEPLVIERVSQNDDAKILAAADIANVCFHDDPKPITAKQLDSQHRIAAHPRSEVLLARFGDTFVASAGAEHPANADDPAVSALFAAAVLEPYRGRGVQQALIIHRLKTALQRGSRVATIHTRPGIPTERNSARLGFRLSYGKLVLARSGPGLVPTPS